MLAVVKEQTGPGFVVKDVPRPQCGDYDLLVRVKSVGLCGSDLPILAGTRTVPWPLIPGHEFAGEVVEVGSQVKSFTLGDRVTSCLVIGCGDCKYCIEGNEPLCDNLLETGIHVDGAFAEYVRVPAKTCLKMREQTSFDEAASVDPVASAYRTVNALPLTTSDTVVVFGAGPIGLYAVQLLKLRGAKCVIIVGANVDCERLILAKKLGADYSVNSEQEDIVQRVREITDGEMADYVQDCAGAPVLADIAMQSLKKQGTYAITGLFHEKVPMDLGKVVRSEISIIGTICYTRQEFKECLDLVEAHRVQVMPLITHHFALRDMEEAYKTALSRKGIKIILHP